MLVGKEVEAPNKEGSNDVPSINQIDGTARTDNRADTSFLCFQALSS
jgi:hypothetical protein